ncbi:MAG: hypothetical protein QXU98_06520, partial [Candidatus Parvarchaeota archaeon]
DTNFQQNNTQSNIQNQSINTSFVENIQKAILKEAYTPPLNKNVLIKLDNNTTLQIKFNANNLSIAINTNQELMNKDYQTRELITNLQNLGFNVENIMINGASVEAQMNFSENHDSKDNQHENHSSKAESDIEFVDAV